MAKRKIDETSKEPQAATGKPSKVVKSTPTKSSIPDSPPITLQIVTGSYERVLHGFTAAVPSSCLKSDSTKESESADFSVEYLDTFLFEAHASAIRCLALSPFPKKDSTEPQRVILASGGTDERVNLYSLSASPAAVNEDFPSVPTLAGNKVLENPKNRELGSLLHHSSTISALCFPSRSKLLAGAGDNTISVTKTRDWTVVSTIKAPRPKVQGRPSGDTAPPGDAPSGVNDFAVHPSMKLMLSVGKGEKCMRLWNLVTGKKAGVLNFTREMLQGVKEGRWSSGEGRRILWNSKGDEFVVAFEWGAIVFGIDSTPICRVVPNPRSKLHQLRYVPLDPSSEDSEEFLAASTEDGRVILFSTKKLQESKEEECSIPYAEAVAQFGGKPCGQPGRVKDFEILSLEGESLANKGDFLAVTGNSDGVVRVWKFNAKDLTGETKKDTKKNKKGSNSKDENGSETRQIGTLLSTQETHNRITCLKAFVMLAPEDHSTLEDSDAFEDEDSAEESSEESDAE